ncbi:hypothetical protein OC845_001112 [Tilletia horrida]|nr:hypothetical protein OC845_001112 [Tilletia horrida]
MSQSIGEPINVIISSNSDPFVLTPRGFLEWASSIQLLPNACIIRENLGGSQQADLGDGNGKKNQTDVLRYSYFTDNTCMESINGGNHARYWRQNGSQQDTGAYFLAASVELPIAQNHDIVSNGYDLGRDYIAGNATRSNGTLSIGGYVFQATSTNAALLSGVSTSDINHNIATDGNVAVLTVRVTKNGTVQGNTTSGTGSTGSGTGASAGGNSSASPMARVTALLAIPSFLTGIALLL